MVQLNPEFVKIVLDGDEALKEEGTFVILAQQICAWPLRPPDLCSY